MYLRPQQQQYCQISIHHHIYHDYLYLILSFELADTDDGDDVHVRNSTCTEFQTSLVALSVMHAGSNCYQQ